MSRTERSAPRGGVGVVLERSVRSEAPERSPLDHAHYAMVLALEASRELARAPKEGPDVSMTFSNRFYLFVIVALLVILATITVIIWMVLFAS